MGVTAEGVQHQQVERGAPPGELQPPVADAGTEGAQARRGGRRK